MLMWVIKTSKHGQWQDSSTEKALEEIKPQFWFPQVGDDTDTDATRIPNNYMGFNNEHP